MRISDWSSDVCSSDLPSHPRNAPSSGVQILRHSRAPGRGPVLALDQRRGLVDRGLIQADVRRPEALLELREQGVDDLLAAQPGQLGRSSCGERVWQYE